MTSLLDHYNMRARLQPALLVLLPLAVATVAWFPPLDPKPSTFLPLVGFVGVTYLFSQIARDRGKAIEPSLWARWGGKPTSRFLRHACATNKLTLARYHEKLASALKRKMPTEEEERESLKEADEVYEAAVGILRTRTRDRQKYPLVFAELVSYGFRRNFYAMRPAGLFVSSISTVACVLAGVVGGAGYTAGESVAWACAAFCALMLALWALRFTADWVKVPAVAYAERLLEACDDLKE